LDNNKIGIMELILEREIRSTTTTIGRLAVNGQFQCFILEDKDRGLRSDMTLDEIKNIKVKTKTAIPTGRYEIKKTFSQKFGKPMWQLMNVPGYEGIRIHPGNFDKDTEGCLLPGEVKTLNAVLNSKLAYSKLDAILDAAAADGEKIFITIND